VSAYPLDDQSGLVPSSDLADDFSVAPFVGLILAAFRHLSGEPSVQRYVEQEPGLRLAIRSLTAAVTAAGVRVRDAGELHGSLDDRLKPYTPAEIWVFDLATDVIALLGSAPGLSGGTRAMMASNLGSLDREASSHRWKKDLKIADPGPEAFRELRARIPRHTLKPERSGMRRPPDAATYAF
jgi:hypothetical protein